MNQTDQHTFADTDDQNATATSESMVEQTRQNYETFFNTIDEFLFVLDEQGRIIHTNSTVVERLGYTREELIGESVLMVHPAERRDEAGRIVGEMLAGKASFCPVPIITKSGRQIPVETRVKMGMWNNRPAIFGVTKDISRIQLSEEKFSKVFYLNPSACGLSDIEDGTYVELNDAFYSLLEFSKDEVIGKTASELGILTTEAKKNVLLHADENGNVLNHESELRTKSGKIKSVLLSSETLFVQEKKYRFTVVHDITDRKRAEELLMQARERLSVTLRSIGDGVITTDIDGRIVMLNKAAEDMTGWNSDDAAGRLLRDVFVIVNVDTRLSCENPVEKVLNTGGIFELGNHTCLISRDGREVLIADRAAPIRDEKNIVTGVVLVFRDVTEKQKLAESVQRTQKLESLGILAGGIAHDFNNMLAGIFGYLDMAKESAAHSNFEQVSQFLNKAITVFDRAKGLTQQLLTFSKGGAPIRKVLNIVPLIRHSATFALSGSNVSSRFEIAENMWWCEVDENQIGQVIDNIVINAKQAMPSGGKIVIAAANVTDEPGHPGKFIRITVQDNGIGIPRDILPKIFDPFFSTKTTGHGLGLATVFSIIQRHDGWIDVASTPGLGTTFHIYLPAAQGSEAADFAGQRPAHHGTGTILLLDDEDYLLEIMGAMLQKIGYGVVTANTGEEALRLFTEAIDGGQPFAASILDLTIPGGSGGKSIAPAMRKIHPSAIIIASSGYSEDPVISNPTDFGFTDRIVKPYRSSELSELMMRVMPA